MFIHHIKVKFSSPGLFFFSTSGVYLANMYLYVKRGCPVLLCTVWRLPCVMDPV